VLVAGIVEVAALAEELDCIGERQESMRKSRGDENLIMVVCGKTDAGPFSKIRRAGTNVHGHIERFAFDDAAKLGPRAMQLIMNSARATAWTGLATGFRLAFQRGSCVLEDCNKIYRCPCAKQGAYPAVRLDAQIHSWGWWIDKSTVDALRLAATVDHGRTLASGRLFTERKKYCGGRGLLVAQGLDLGYRL